ASEIATLNGQVQKVEISGGFSNDERDRRDLLIKKMGELIDIKWAEGEDKTVTISTGNNAILVAGLDSKRLEAVPTPGNESKAEGDYDIVYYHHEYAEPLVLTDRIKGGKLGGVLHVRDQEVRGFQQRIDSMAYTLGKSINDVHEQGYNAFNMAGTQFFEPLANDKDAAANFRLNTQVQADVGRIAAAFDPNLPGDNRVANMIADIQHKKGMFDGNTSIDEYYNGMVAELGLRTQKANRQAEVQAGVVKQLENLRESISGVNIDEEVASMIEWQKQFDASARIIRTADEMLDTVLNIRR
ncbi:MAG: flagellar hook-associated protein FlgK, partial [Bdellovibrionales bacterium]|nr:flagellar hook-associated protein FlgK [Bdellovibrionales bacterium]